MGAPFQALLMAGAAAGDPYLANVKYHMNSFGISDIGPSNRPVYATSGVATSTAQARTGTNSIAISAPAANSANLLRIPASTDFLYGSTDWTWEISCRFTTFAATAGYIMSQGNGQQGGGAETSLDLFYTSTGNKLVFRVTVTALAALTLTSTTALSLNTWYDIMVSKSGSTYYLFINGGLETSGTYATALPSDIAMSVAIGTSQAIDLIPTPAALNFIGFVSDGRITAGVARNTSSYTPSLPLYATNPNPSVPQDANFASVSHLYNNATLLPTAWAYQSYNAANNPLVSHFKLVTISTAVISQAQAPFAGGYSMLMDGSNLCTFATQFGSFALGSADWTLEIWVYADPASATGELISLRPAAGNGFWILRYNSAKTVRMFANDGSGTTITDVTTTNTITSSTWTHVAACRVSGTVSVYIGGVKANTSTTNLSGAYSAPNVPVEFGNSDGGGSPFKGYLALPRITAGVARYTSNFTPPTGPYPTS